VHCQDFAPAAHLGPSLPETSGIPEHRWAYQYRQGGQEDECRWFETFSNGAGPLSLQDQPPRVLQAKCPNRLSGRRVDLGAAGIFYRALVGPFESAEKAAKLCRGLEAARGDCMIQKN
jgi:hypothetical protein